MNLARFPRRSSVQKPTRLEFLPAFSKAQGDMIRLWIKRDDLLRGIEAVTMLARTGSSLLDPVYSGKAMSGLMDLTRKGCFPEGAKVLILHTGGSPALYACEDTFRKAWQA